MALLTAAQILDASDLPTEDVDMPEWGGAVRVRTLTAGERDRWEKSTVNRQGKKTFDNIRAKLVAISVVDAEGKRLFTEDQVEALGRKSSKALDRLAGVAMALSGVSPQDIEDLVGKDEASSNGTA